VNRLAEELDEVLARTTDLWEGLRGARIFMTGGTGFFGCWLLETLLWATDRLALHATVTVLTRNGGAFHEKAPHLARHPAVTLREGDLRTADLDPGSLSHVVHAAGDGRGGRSALERREIFDTIVIGTRQALAIARRGAARRFLLTSTGAVYGRQPATVSHVPESYSGGGDPADPDNVGPEAKRAAEALCAAHASESLEPVIARCFAFVGPYLPLDSKFAAGNFIADGLRGDPIRIAGDGTPIRSYLYASDLAVWLWTILLSGRPLRTYNVGAETSTSIADLADATARCFTPSPPVRVTRAPRADIAPERYVPSTQRARQELGLEVTVGLDEALRRTIAWHRSRGTS
jgi:dTDP-glucose 4,6-dehydratase